MKKTTLLGGTVSLPQNLLKKLLLSCFAMVVMFSSYAANIASAGNGNWTSTTPNAPWPGGIVPGLGDVVTISAGNTVTVNTATVICSGLTISGGTLVLQNGGTANSINLTVDGPWLYNSGTFTPNQHGVTFGTGGSIGGTLPTTFRNLEISTTNATDIVTLATSGTTVANSSGGGILTLTKGVFLIGAGNTLNMEGGGGSNTINNPGVVGTSNFAATGINGIDGGTLNFTNQNPVTINGPGLTTFFNLSSSSHPPVTITTPGTVLINGTVTVGTTSTHLQFVGANGPIYGAASNLLIKWNSASYTQGAEWNATSGYIIGTTPGYPNNVSISGFCCGQTATYTNNKNIYGVLTIGDGTGSNDNNIFGANFSCGGIIINSGEKVTGPSANMVVNGSWYRAATATYLQNGGLVSFGNGLATCSAPNTINAAAGSETFSTVAIISNANVSLSVPVTVSTIALTSGILTTTPTNILTVTTTGINGITGGSNTAYINGPVKWNLGAAAGLYKFPMGSGTCTPDYLPFTLNKATGATTATVQAFTPGSGGTADITLGALSSTEYWSFATTAALSSGSTISLSRSTPLPITPLAAIAQSTTGATGTYTSLAGTAVANGVNNSNTISTNTSLFYTLGAPPIVSTLAATSITTTTVTLNGAFNTGSSKTTSFNYGTSAPAYGTTVNTLLSPINSSTATLDSQFVTGLIANTVYHYLATDGTDNGSDVTFITAPNPPVVGTPNTPTVSGFTATWSAPAAMGNAPYTYTIQVSTDPTFATGVITQTGIASGTPTSSYVFTTLASATQYYYRVEAVNATANSAWSATSTPISTLIFPTPACTSGGGSVTDPGSITKATSAPTIDGNPGDAVWAGAPDNVISQKINIASASPLQAVPNNTATCKAMWDANYLYLLVQVQDATLISQGALAGATNIATLNAGANPWDVDGIELYLDGNNSKGGTCAGGSYDGQNDFQIRFNLGSATVTGSTSVASGNIAANPNFQFSMAVVPGGYVLETKIPWTGVGGLNTGTGAYPSIIAGNKIGIDYSINDNDGTQWRTAQTGWFDGKNVGCAGSTEQYHIPYLFGTGTLNTCPQPPVVVSPTVTNITATGATLGATVTSSGDAALTVRGTGISQSPDNSGSTNALPEGGTGVSAYSGPARTGLLPQTQYYYLGYATNANAKTGISDTLSFYTLSALPATQPTLSACGANNNLTLSWSAVTFPPTSAATNAGYLILRRQDGTDPTTAGINTRVPATQAALPAGTTLLTTITNSSTLTYVDASAVAGTTYNYLLVPYTYDGSTIDSTYNYLTAAAPTTSASIGGGSGTPVVTIGNINSPVNLGTPILLIGNSTITGTPTWSVTPTAPIVDPTILSTSSIPTAIDTYTYTLSVNAAGCIGTAQKVVSVVNAGCDIKIPNAFTPNNDGFNDTWKITGNCYTVITVDVYNRWGSRVYHSDNYSSGSEWDGKYQGKDVADATYYYVVTAHSPTANPIFKGSVTVVR
jgi:gliding motility-associated-like protein